MVVFNHVLETVITYKYNGYIHVWYGILNSYLNLIARTSDENNF